MNEYAVFFISDAEEDLIKIYNFIALNDSVSKAKNLINKIEKSCKDLSLLPTRGHIPPELEKIGVFNYREVHCKSYRIIYQVLDNDVYVHSILDSRRNLSQLLQERLIRT